MEKSKNNEHPPERWRNVRGATCQDKPTANEMHHAYETVEVEVRLRNSEAPTYCVQHEEEQTEAEQKENEDHDSWDGRYRIEHGRILRYGWLTHCHSTPLLNKRKVVV